MGAPSVFGAYYVNKEYFDLFEDYDVLAISIPYQTNLKKLKKFVSMLDGLVMTGGFDIPSSFFDEKMIEGPSYSFDEDRVSYEFQLLKLVEQRSLPIFGICMGMQVYNVYKGGSLYQDLYSQLDKPLNHSSSSADGRLLAHEVFIKKSSYLRGLLNCDHIMVNSSHHQSIKDPGKDIIICAQSSDGVVEAIESLDGQFLGLQWHPEALQGTLASKTIIEDFINKL
ncbi:gamma-glutamyl-gamma-aminobutyrate hydrolase family protein, partial [bacterium]|nr:gamma-glutamyl-gamma-aminobutyrate hydrolase family protein [bacterium]